MRPADKNGEAKARTKAGAAALRMLPSVDECLRAAENDGALGAIGRGWRVELIRNALAQVRTRLAGGAGEPAESRERLAALVIAQARAALANAAPPLRAVVNGTGVVLHTNLGRALLAESAIDAIATAARAPVNLEYDLDSGGRGERDALVEADLCALTGAEAATVVNNNAAALLIALNTLANGREAIVSRGELIEIGGSFRLPELMAQSGARLREVGTTNRTHPADYVRAIGPDTATLLKVHPSNYRIVGFTTAVELGELAAIGRAHRLPVVEDLGAGAMIDLSRYGLPREPIVAERIAAGADLVTFSGDKLLGGPQAGIVVGRRELIDRIRRNPLKRALRCDKLTLAALAATLEIYRRADEPADLIPALRMLRRNPAELEEIAQAARAVLADRLGGGYEIEVIESAAEIGSGAQPTEQIESRALRITHPELSADAIAAMFRRARPPVIGRIRDGAFMIDLRAIEDPSALAVAFPSS
ncbi:L-seryl-tRNA(Sec) selenium transferase [bacterium]|nr:L-seryl-tRNA(Sec) selenium transferase [bacterium]